MSLNIKGLLDTVRKGVEFVEGIAPSILSLIPGAGPIIATAVQAAGAVTEVITNIKARVDEGTIVLNSDDAAEIDGYVERLAKVNDELAAYIDQN
jgi:hypothetical protein